MTVSTLLRAAQRVLSTTIVAAVGAGCLVAGGTATSAATDAHVGVVKTSKEFRVAPARKEYRRTAGKVAPARKEYRQTAGQAAPRRKEYRQTAGQAAPRRKEYRQTAGSASPRRKEYRHAATRRHVAPRISLVSYTVATVSTDGYVGRVLRLVNRARARHHLHAVSRVGCAQRRAVRWSRHLAATQTFKHQSMKRVMRACGARYAGETLGRGSMTPRRLVRMWLDSTPHRRVLLSSTARRIGVGATRGVDGRWVVAADLVRL